MEAQICTISPSLAKQMLETNKNNRKVSKGRVKMYAEDMRNGKWKLNGQAISFYADKTLADGQHRLLAIIESNTPIRSLVITGLERDVMPTIDSGKERSLYNDLQFEGIKNAETIASIIRKYVAIRNNLYIGHSNGLDAGAASSLGHRSEQLDFYREHKELVENVTRLSSKWKSRFHLLGVSIYGSICLHLILDKWHEESVVYEFFEQLTSGRCSNQSIAGYRDWLLMNRTKEDKYGAAVEMNALAQCWNDYVSGNVRKRVLSGKVLKEKIAMK